MNRFPPDIDPKIYTLSAAIIGFALIDDFTANEQNAIANWFLLIGQVLETNSAFQQINEERIEGNTININSNEYKTGGKAYMRNKAKEKHPFDQKEDIIRLEKVINIMQKEIDDLKKNR
jgi:hypothetical protein